MTADEFAANLTGSDQCTIRRTGEWAYEVTLAGRQHLVELSEQDRQQPDSEWVSAFCYRLAQAIAAKPAHMNERKVLDRYTGYADWLLKDAELLARIDHMPVLEGLQEWRKVHPEDFADLFDEDNQPRAGAPLLFP